MESNFGVHGLFECLRACLVSEDGSFSFGWKTEKQDWTKEAVSCCRRSLWTGEVHERFEGGSVSWGSRLHNNIGLEEDDIGWGAKIIVYIFGRGQACKF